MKPCSADLRGKSAVPIRQTALHTKRSPLQVAETPWRTMTMSDTSKYHPFGAQPKQLHKMESN